ncbi:MAG: Flp pilus assembly protein CpaB, partial [Firmicutes bacterium]|nr:Flp pilus assembly protein CpaB [Bacillota bacterium]
MAKFSPKVLFVIALLLSAVTAMLVYNFLVKSGTKPPKMGVPVVVAKVNIPPKTRITVDMLERAEVPSEYVQPGAMSDADAVAGIMARGLIVAGEQITEQRLAVKGKGDGFSGIVPPNMRAVTVAVTEVTGVAGFVKAGDTVDLVATFDQSTAGEDSSRIILQNVQVLAVDRETEVPINTNGSE